jgi:hypothetical protein
MHYKYEKMIVHRHDDSSPEMPHWCISLVPDDVTATVTYLQSRDAQNLTLAEAKLKVDMLNEKLAKKARA